jgi:predicted nucleic acid-binding protein
MSVKAFIDTNILVYLYSADQPDKRGAAINALSAYECHTSAQVLNEFAHVFSRKLKRPATEVLAAIDEIKAQMAVHGFSAETVERALSLRDQLNYHYFDCVIVASALEHGCPVLLTEDLDDGHVVNGMVRIKNIFQQAE